MLSVFVSLFFLSKVLYSFLNKLLIAKPVACGFDMNFLRLIYDHLINRKEIVNVSKTRSSSKKN